MSCRPILRDVSQQTQSDTSETTQHFLPNGEPRPADVEMARVLKTAPVSMASDPASGAIAHWKHGALHDVVEPMADHVIMTYPTGVQRLERRNGKSVAIGTARSGVVTIIPAGSSARWDIPGPVNVVQLYLPHTTLERVAGEADTSAPGDLLERTGHPDPITSRLLMSAADALEGNAALDALFRHQLTDLLATRLLAAHTGSPTTFQPTMGGLSRQRRCAARSSACARTTIRTSPSPRWLRMPACRASTSAAPSRKAPGSRRMPGCASTGSSRP